MKLKLPVPQLQDIGRVEAFPRSDQLTHHSPLFWVENKDRFLRQLMIRDIEQLTGRRLCTYFCSSYFDTSLTADDKGRLLEIVNTDGRKPFDLLLETAGGETDATEGLVEMLRDVNPDFRVIVPSRAKSNGTVIGLAAKEIVMGATSELGPIEPSLNNRPVSVLMTDEFKRHNFPLYKAGHDAFLQTKKLATTLLKSGMMKGRSKRDLTEAINKLCTRDHFHSHGSVISGTEAQKLGLKIRMMNPDDELWKRYWLLHSMYAFDSAVRGVGKFFEGNKLSLAISGNDPVKRKQIS
jgi:ClpP class serine protease